MADILGPLIVGLALLLYIVYRIRSARHGKETSIRSLDFMLALGLSARWFLLVIFPVIIVVMLLMGKFAPGALEAIPLRLFPDIIFAAAALTVAAAFCSLWRRNLR
jgi:hypothetical protein